MVMVIGVDVCVDGDATVDTPAPALSAAAGFVLGFEHVAPNVVSSILSRSDMVAFLDGLPVHVLLLLLSPSLPLPLFLFVLPPPLHPLLILSSLPPPSTGPAALVLLLGNRLTNLTPNT